MKLYYCPGACSMASHITANELQIPIDLVRVDLASHRTEDGSDYYAVNSAGYVPTLVFDDGASMTESAAVLQYLADSAAPSTMLAPVGDIARYRAIEMMTYISTEIHQKLGPLLNPAATDEAKAMVHDRVHARLSRLEDQLSETPFLTGLDFTIADAYAFAILAGVRHFGVSIDNFPNVGAFVGRIAARPAVVAMLRAEGLIS